MRAPALLILLVLAVAACGENRYAARAPDLGPQHYVIDPDDVPEEGQHIRYAAPGAGRSGGLDIAITEYRSEAGRAPVALIGVVHVADAPYFDALQRELDAYPHVLYEGVKPEGMSGGQWQQRFQEEGGRAAELQQALAGWFGFIYQLDAIDYRRPNLVHADMSMEEFLEAGGGRFLDLTEIPGAGDDEDAEPQEASEETAEEDGQADVASSTESATNLGADVQSTWAAVKAFGDMALGKPSPMRSLARRMFAKTLGTIDMGKALAMRPGFNDLILIKRNQVVMEKLEDLLPQTTQPIAIFYGAAHMPDLEERLVRDLGYARVGGRWLRAWAMRPPLERK